MPHYYFDTDDGSYAVADESGLDFPDQEAARRAAVSALPDMARDRIPNGDNRTFSVRVRDEHGNTIYSASLAMTGRWHGNGSL